MSNDVVYCFLFNKTSSNPNDINYRSTVYCSTDSMNFCCLEEYFHNFLCVVITWEIPLILVSLKIKFLNLLNVENYSIFRDFPREANKFNWNIFKLEKSKEIFRQVISAS